MTASHEAAANPFFEAIRRHFSASVPHVQALGIEIDYVGADCVRVHMTPGAEHVGDPERQFIHTGVLSALIDSAAGAAMLGRLQQASAIATLDLRIDYLRPVVVNTRIDCHAECYRLTSEVAFVRAKVTDLANGLDVAESLATFVRPANSGGDALIRGVSS